MRGAYPYIGKGDNMKTIISRLWEKAIFTENAEMTASSDYAEVRAMAKKSDIDTFLAEYNAIAPDKLEYVAPSLNWDYITFDDSPSGEYVPFAAMGGCVQDHTNSTRTLVTWFGKEDVIEAHSRLLINYYNAQGSAEAAYRNEKVSPDYTGEVSVWVEQHYYPGTYNAPENGYHTEGPWNEPVVFDTYAEAEVWIAEAEAEDTPVYGRYSAPDYTIVKACYN
jgi:hypothetical protein